VKKSERSAREKTQKVAGNGLSIFLPVKQTFRSAKNGTHEHF